MINAFAGTNNVALAHRDLHTREAGLVRRQEGDGLVVHSSQGARPFDDLPLEREIVLDAAPRTIARQGPQLFGLAHPHHDRCRRHRHAEKRSSELEELPLPALAEFRLCRPENDSVDLVRERRRTRHGRAVEFRPERPGVDVEPVIFLGRQR